LVAGGSAAFSDYHRPGQHRAGSSPQTGTIRRTSSRPDGHYAAVGAVVTFTATELHRCRRFLDASATATVTVPSWLTGTSTFHACVLCDIKGSARRPQRAGSLSPHWATPLVVTARARRSLSALRADSDLRHTALHGGTPDVAHLARDCTTTATTTTLPAHAGTCMVATSSLYAISYGERRLGDRDGAPADVTAPTSRSRPARRVPSLTAAISASRRQTLATSGVHGTQPCTNRPRLASIPAAATRSRVTQARFSSAIYSFGTLRPAR